jgi:hypothetical protein
MSDMSPQCAAKWKSANALTAVDGNAGFRQSAYLAAELDEAYAHLADRTAIVLAEIRKVL